MINQSNIDCLFEICSEDKKDKDRSKRYIKLLSCVKVDNLHENQMKLNSPHLLSHKLILEDEDVLERLIRINQSYKTELSHALNTGQKDFHLMRQIYRMDYRKPWNDQNSSFDIELSFTWLDWQIMDMVNSAEHFYIEDID